MIKNVPSFSQFLTAQDSSEVQDAAPSKSVLGQSKPIDIVKPRLQSDSAFDLKSPSAKTYFMDRIAAQQNTTSGEATPGFFVMSTNSSIDANRSTALEKADSTKSSQSVSSPVSEKNMSVNRASVSNSMQSGLLTRYFAQE